MSVHKLTAGDGYTYLTRQVAVHDATDRGHSGLADYYAEKGESPGRWFGAGMPALDVAVGSEVSEAQMRNLFGEGRHPDAERLEDAALDRGAGVEVAKKASQLGRLFAIYRGNQPEFIQETARRYVAYNLEHDRRWNAPVPAEERARIRTELGEELFYAEHGRAPIDDRERGAFLAKATRQQTTAVAGYDLTFAPVKSVSTLWALADRPVAKEVEAAHHAAVEATLQWLEQNVLFTRRGRGGVQQVPTRGLVAAMFTHRDARSGDPHLHTHIAVSNKVQDETGRWLAVDGRVLFKANVTLAEMYNTRIEAELTARLGVRFDDANSDRAVARSADGKRAVREVVGIDRRLIRSWSSRNRAIEARRRELAAAFQVEHGRPPTEGEAVTLGEKAWDQTRQAKHAPRAEAEQRATWTAEAIDVLGTEGAVHSMVETCLSRTVSVPLVDDEWVNRTAKAVVARIAKDRATWQIWHLRAEAHRTARTASISLANLDEVVDRVVTTAINDHSIAFDEPDPLTRGTSIPAPLQRTEQRRGPDAKDDEVVSVYSLAGSRQYTSRAVVEAEQRILAAARRTGGRTASDVRVAVAVASSRGEDGPRLNAAQRSMVRELATSGRAVQLALAPAGTGKTTAMQALTRAWHNSAGTVIGFAPSAAAAHELSEAINHDVGTGGREVHADTLAKLVWHAANPDQSASGDGGAPSWIHEIGTESLVLVDEAGMASTTDLATAIDYVTSRGGQVRLIGDDRQLASVGAGGILRDIAHQVGAVTLSEVHRFRNLDGSVNHAEAAATLALRDGDPSAIAFYADRGRIHVGDLGVCADQAYQAWAADTAGDGTNADSILIAPTRELVAELNTRARNDRLSSDTADQHVGRVVTLADGTHASAGDRIITRRNDRRLRLSRTNWVKNGDRWTIAHVNYDGSIRAVHDHLNTTVTLPADYVVEDVQLGYATTVHGAQGITIGTCHVVMTGAEDRNLLYVALSRGRYANHLYLATTSDGDPHNLIRPEALLPPTTLDKVAQMLARDGSPVSATTALRDQNDPHRLLHDLAARYHDAVTTGAEHLIGPAGMNRMDTHADALLPGLTDAPAWPTLRSHLALTALNSTTGDDPLRLLSRAVAVGPLTDARDPAAVLDARIDDLRSPSEAAEPTEAGPVPWLPSVPTRLATARDWGPFTTRYRQLVRDQVDAVRTQARHWNGATAPAWARPFLEPDHVDLLADLAVWRAVNGTDPNDLRPTGARTIGAPGAHQAALNRAVHVARPTYPFTRRTWYLALPETVRADSWITPLCHRLARLERAGLPVTDYIQEALTSDPTSPATAAVPRPLPDEHQAAALWWRLVPYLGPAALDADEHTADLRPAWHADLVELVGATKADYLRTTPAWPALVAAVDEAFAHHDWTPSALLARALEEIPQDGTLAGVDIADALVLRIAGLTDSTDRPDQTADFADLDTNQNPYAPARLPWEIDDVEITSEDAFPDPHELPAERIHDLNQQALTFYETQYRTSWAPAYLTERLGTDLTDHPTFTAGYAPGTGQSLLRHLTNRGATIDELVQAGLVTARERDEGTTDYRDFFRDRLVLPIRDPNRHSSNSDSPDRSDSPEGRAEAGGTPIIGFIGRRNPTKTDDDYAGPKYLNTRTTAIFSKSEALFGYADARDQLAAGALPVIVEGPMDALAITLATKGDAVGLAPMGTALTVSQIKLIRAHLDLVNGRDHIAVATDPDPAGRTAAQKAYWHLTTADLDPTLIALPDGTDPATLLETAGADAVAAAIVNRVPLGDVMIDHLLRTAGSWADTDVRQRLIHHAAAVIAARGAEHWLTTIEHLQRRLHLAAGILEHATITASIDRDHDPVAYARHHIDQINSNGASKPANASADATRRSGLPPIALPTDLPIQPTPPPPTTSREASTPPSR